MFYIFYDETSFFWLFYISFRGKVFCFIVFAYFYLFSNLYHICFSIALKTLDHKKYGTEHDEENNNDHDVSFMMRSVNKESKSSKDAKKRVKECFLR